MSAGPGSKGDSARRENRLARETSPYLLQHRANPVDWYPWGEEALARAKAENKPIFLSIGYSSCHWCHVMERESFENVEIARVLNAHFVPIKVDREERPDLDEVYMKAVQLVAGQGGWPMSVWLTPDLEPFYGGTYFPPNDRWGRPGFLAVLHYLHGLWRDHRDRCTESAKELRRHVEQISLAAQEPSAIDESLLDEAEAALGSLFDADHGGFGSAPKFPHPMDLALLLRRHMRPSRESREARAESPARRRIIEVSLEKMARGGIYDQVGGGFHRYSVDERWLVPHFEKMLYDNALLIPVYADAAACGLAPASLFARVARETCDYLEREMTGEGGGFYSATDADSEGEEGRYFVWTQEEIRTALGADADAFARCFGVTAGGNFEGGANVLEQVGSEEERARLAPSLAKLRELRSRREKPYLDDKVLAEWNGLMIGGIARAASRLSEPRWTKLAERAAAFLVDRMVVAGRLKRTHRAGESRIDAFLQDHACLIHGLLELSAVSANPRWLAEAIRLSGIVRSRFAAGEGGYFATAEDQESPLGRSRDPFDHATPSGNSVMATNLLRLSEITGDAALRDEARKLLESFAPAMRQASAGFGWMLQAVDRVLHAPPTVVVVGTPGAPDFEALRRAAAAVHGADVLLADGSQSESPSAPAILRGKAPRDGKAVAYVCREQTCLPPIADPARLAAALAD